MISREILNSYLIKNVDSFSEKEIEDILDILDQEGNGGIHYLSLKEIFRQVI